MPGIEWSNHRPVMEYARSQGADAACLAQIVLGRESEAGRHPSRGAVRDGVRRFMHGVDTGGKFANCSPPAQSATMPPKVREALSPSLASDSFRPCPVPPPVRLKRTEPGSGRRGILALFDPHHPYQDQRSIDAALAFGRDKKVRAVVWGGDNIENFGQSRFSKPAARQMDPRSRLLYEVEVARPNMLATCEFACEVHILRGNHDDRAQTAIDEKLPGLDGLIEWPHLYNLPAHATFDGEQVRLGGIRFVHGDKHGGKSCTNKAHQLLVKHGDHNICCGHTHHLKTECMTSYKDDLPEPKIAIEGGHLSLRPDWAPEDQVAGWTTGFVYFEEWGDGLFTPHAVPIVDGRFCWDGVVYGRPWQ